MPTMYQCLPPTHHSYQSLHAYATLDEAISFSHAADPQDMQLLKDMWASGEFM